MNTDLQDTLDYFRSNGYKEVSTAELKHNLELNIREEQVVKRLRELGYRLRNSGGEIYCNLEKKPVMQRAFLLGMPEMKAILNK